MSLWTSDLILSNDQIKLIKSNKSKAQGKDKSEKAYQKRLNSQMEGRVKAKEGNVLHAMGCMLYWGEGSKNRNMCGLTNGDPAIMQIFQKFLKECYGINNDEMMLSLNFYTNNNLSANEIEEYWLNLLQIPKENLYKSQIDVIPISSKGRKHKRILPYGIARISVNNTDLVQNIFGAIQEYSGYDNFNWAE